MKLKTLKALRDKYPHLTDAMLKTIVNKHLSTINKKVKGNQTFSLNVSKFGRIHTHGNAVNYKLRNRSLFLLGALGGCPRAQL